MESSCRLAHLSVCACLSVGLSVRKVYCGKTANWIRMSLEMVSEVGRGMGVLDRGGDAASPKLRWDFLFIIALAYVRMGDIRRGC